MENMESNHLDEKEIILAKINLAEMTKCYEEMAAAVKELVHYDPELTNQEFYWLAVAYKNVVNIRRDSWIVVTNTQRKELLTGNIENITKAQSMRTMIENEMRTYCSEILVMLDEKLIPYAITNEGRVVCLKLKGDYHRYLAEFEVGIPYEQAKLSARHAYSTAYILATSTMSATHPMRLALILNYSVFEYEFLKNRDIALELAERAHDEAIAELGTLGEEEIKIAVMVLNLLRYNMVLWMGESEQQKPEESNKSIEMENPFLMLIS